MQRSVYVFIIANVCSNFSIQFGKFVPHSAGFKETKLTPLAQN